jgi:hypothetical protein
VVPDQAVAADRLLGSFWFIQNDFPCKNAAPAPSFSLDERTAYGPTANTYGAHAPIIKALAAFKVNMRGNAYRVRSGLAEIH